MYHADIDDVSDSGKPCKFQILHATRGKESRRQKTIFRATDELEMWDWANSVLKQQIVIEQIIDSIVVY